MRSLFHIFKTTYWLNNDIEGEKYKKTFLQQELEKNLFGKKQIKVITVRTFTEEVIKILEKRIDENITETYCKERAKEMLK